MTTSVEGNLVWVGAETGVLKRVDLTEKSATNYRHTDSGGTGDERSKRNEIVAMCWASERQSELCTALRSGVVNTFNVDNNQYTGSHQCADDGVFVGIARSANSLVMCTDSGSLTVWNDEWKKDGDINVGKDVCRMRLNKSEQNLVVTGGKENQLKIWDITKPEEPVFKSKNVANDFLNLRVPVWFTDMSFMSNSQKIVTCTRYHQVRVYDPSSPQRRPVIDYNCGENPLTACSILPDNQTVIVGDSVGRMVQLDLRKCLQVKVFKGFAGGIRSIECHTEQPWVVSCGLDRFLRVHSLTSNSLLHKVYLKSRLNCVLLPSKIDVPAETVSKVAEVRSEKLIENNIVNMDITENHNLSSENIAVVESPVREIISPGGLAAIRRGSLRKTKPCSYKQTRTINKKKSTTTVGESVVKKSLKLTT